MEFYERFHAHLRWYYMSKLHEMTRREKEFVSWPRNEIGGVSNTTK
jgi:hypothetical protein